MTIRAIENAAGRRELSSGKGDLRRVTVKSATGTRSEMLPSDPHEVARILCDRAKKTPAQRMKERLLADLAKRTSKDG